LKSVIPVVGVLPFMAIKLFRSPAESKRRPLQKFQRRRLGRYRVALRHSACGA
jgi:hypothetical protein